MDISKSRTSINFHLLEACNMRCGFCFAKYGKAENIINLHDAKAIIDQIALAGFGKISFAGGEPLLYPKLLELIAHAKSYGLTTMIITNGYRLTPHFLDSAYGYLDWVGLSIDSLNQSTNLFTGRVDFGSTALGRAEYLTLTSLIKNYGYGLKINTVVHRYNHQEGFRDFINTVKPSRWKIMQVIFNQGANHSTKNQYSITEEDFSEFVIENRITEPFIEVVAESEDLIRGSYLMVDPQGRLYDSQDGKHIFSPGILDVGFENALEYIQFDHSKFQQRKGAYNWDIHNPNQ